MQDNLAIRFSAVEPVIAWPKPALEWARTEGVLAAFVRGNVEAYRRERHVLFEHFPEVRTFMDRHCGYHILMESLSRLEISARGDVWIDLTDAAMEQRDTISALDLAVLDEARVLQPCVK